MGLDPISIAAIGGLASAGIQGISASNAANAQTVASNKQLKLQRRVYDETTQRFAPFLGAGENALGAYKYELGLGEAPSGYSGMNASPWFNKQLEMGRDTIESGAAARGKLFSGSTGTALEKYRMGLASQETNNYLNRLANMTTMGQSSAGAQAAAGQNFATGASNALANAGNAQAAGAIGVGNALASGIDTGMGLYGYLSSQPQPATTMARPIPRPASFYG